jgi:8-oxo-dGTP pyrophosphatase MutT (NUDIX family)
MGVGHSSSDDQPTRRESAVLVPVHRGDDGRLRLVLVIRGARGIHAGQLALPGGKVEPADASPLAAALREAFEEIRLRPGDVDILAAFDPIDARTTGFRVHPFLGRLVSLDGLKARAGEIAGLAFPLLHVFADEGRRQRDLLEFPTWPQPRLTEYVDIDAGRVWGLTLRVLDAVVPAVMAGEWDL